jgi:hypothetical protein
MRELVHTQDVVVCCRDLLSTSLVPSDSLVSANSISTALFSVHLAHFSSQWRKHCVNGKALKPG